MWAALAAIDPGFQTATDASDIGLALLVPETKLRWLGVGFGVVFTLNLLAAVPPTPSIAALLPVAGPIGVVGSVAMLREGDRDQRAPAR